jgi:biopolymer transport protein ExbD
VDSGFSAASMTDMVFLLLMFVLMALTLVNPNALRLVLPKSNSQVTERPYTTVSITAAGKFFVENTPVDQSQLEGALQEKLAGKDKPLIALHMDENAAVKYQVMLYNVAVKNQYTVILRTSPE